MSAEGADVRPGIAIGHRENIQGIHGLLICPEPGEACFDEPLYTQYLTTMEKVFTGDLVSYTTQLDVLDQIVEGIPRTMSLAIGAAILWMFFATALGLYSAMRAGRFAAWQPGPAPP